MFGKFMNKKFFHPGSYPNQKKKWIHQQRSDAREKQESEKKATYEKEQESYQSRLLSAKTTEDKMKLDLNFLYDVPPGLRKDEKEEENEEEVKFEWQKNAPRSKYVKDLGLECQDQPFGICVKNIRCFKCKQWGHQNTDRECPLFFANIPTSGSSGKSQAESLRLSDPLRLVDAMKKQHGLTLKQSVIGAEIDPMAENQQLLDSDEDQSGDRLDDSDMAYIASLNDKQKKKLLKKLEKMQKKNKKEKKKKRKHRRPPDKEKRHQRHIPSSSQSEDEQTTMKTAKKSETDERNTRNIDYRELETKKRKRYSSPDSEYEKWEMKRTNRTCHVQNRKNARLNEISKYPYEDMGSKRSHSSHRHRRVPKRRRRSSSVYSEGDSSSDAQGETGRNRTKTVRNARRSEPSEDEVDKLLSECRRESRGRRTRR